MGCSEAILAGIPDYLGVHEIEESSEQELRWGRRSGGSISILVLCLPAQEVPVRRIAIAFAAIIAALVSAPTTSARSTQPHQLTFEDRVKAQEAIERVYYSHQIGASAPFDQAVPTDLIEEKVRRSLQQSVALEQRWGVKLTEEQLQVELERVARGTRFPERLIEIYGALANDPVRVQECFIRPLLVDRLSRALFESDPRVHAAARGHARAVREKLASGVIRAQEESPARHVVEVRLAVGRDAETPRLEQFRAVQAEEFARIRALAPSTVGDVGPVEEGPDSLVIRVILDEEAARFRMATFLVPKRQWEEWWISARGSFDPARAQVVASTLATLPATSQTTAGGTLLPCSLDDTWDNGALDDLPTPRTGHTAVWTGSLMIVWGGTGSGGSRYDPVTDSWHSISFTNAPARRISHTAVWTGQEMIVWGGHYGFPPMGDGARYDPGTDVWTPLAIDSAGAPSARYQHTAVWTGSRMVVWGGTDGADLDSGGSYDPGTDSWAPISAAGAPSGRRKHSAVWTGTEMIVWGGSNSAALGDGGRYQAQSNTWVPVSVTNAPAPRDGHTVVWTDTRMIVWGGTDGMYTFHSTGGIYDPATDTWSSTSLTGAPSGRESHTAVWTGSRMVVWGGQYEDSYIPHYGYILDSGARYDPATDTWSSIISTRAPPARSLHSAVWTGSLMVIWGGGIEYEESNPAFRYDPAANAWLTPSPNKPPYGRENHQAVWTGNHMLVWGGLGQNSLDDYIRGGGRYDPLTDTWAPMTRAGEPHGRVYFTAIWSGRFMIVWGGYSGYPGPATWYNSGSRYDPISDSWSPVSLSGAPVKRQSHSAVWTGREMIVWGGVHSPTTYFGSGGAYNPDTDTWRQLSTTGAPLARYAHSGIWTGAEMIVWGGSNAGVFLRDGGRYEPGADSWSSMTAVDAPEARVTAPAVWTGREMIIWGGHGSYSGEDYMNTGGRYDPLLDRWLPTSMMGAPTARQSHSMVWTGSLAVIWGGDTDPLYVFKGDGGRYDPVSDSWSSMTSLGVPPPRTRHSAVWTGQFMIVWGGYSGYRLYDGGRYVAAPALDHDGDLVMICAGDCDDSDPAVYPGAPEICDGLNNDCGDPSWPAVPGNEVDIDGDGLSECQGDCNDVDAQSWSAPGEVLDMTLRPDSATLDWLAPAVGGATSLSYDTLRSGVATNFVIETTCVESDDGADTVANDASTPAPSGIFYYLVRAENGCPGGVGIGPLGNMSDGTPRTGRICLGCGDGMKRGAELCDGSDLGGETCQSQGFELGALTCSSACNSFVTSGCSFPVCGDGMKRGAELCDGSDLGGETCQSQGFNSGALACSSTCGSFVTSGCSFAVCGDGIKTDTEVCDGSDLGGETCQSQGWESGILTCASGCFGFDTSGCRQ